MADELDPIKLRAGFEAAMRAKGCGTLLRTHLHTEEQPYVSKWIEGALYGWTLAHCKESTKRILKTYHKDKGIDNTNCKFANGGARCMYHCGNSACTKK